MGALDDLLRQLQEAAEERQKTTMPGRAPAAPGPVVQQRPVAEQRTAADQRAAAQQREAAQQRAAAQQRVAAKAAAARQAAARAAVEHEEMAPTPLAQVAGVAEVAGVHAVPLSLRPSFEHPLLTRLRQPGGAREALVLSEILRSRWRR